MKFVRLTCLLFCVGVFGIQADAARELYGQSAESKSVAVEQLTAEEAVEEADRIWADELKDLAGQRKAEMEAKLIELDQYPKLSMKYEFKVFGEKPATGHSLFISMHGGGGAPPRVNEQQWRNQIRLYSPKEGIYLAPRAPTDTWNLWHQKHVDDFFERIIENFVVSGEVDPNRVYLMGYSAGGDGVYQLAPRIGDRFAAVAMMAGHPNETKPIGLRNIPFALFMGGRDSAFKRNKIAEDWKQKLAELRDSDPEGYDHEVTIYPSKGHWMDRKDAVALQWMTKRIRNVWPKKVVWHQDDVTHDRLYWLSVPAGNAAARTTVTASVEGQKISVDSKDVKEVRIWLSDELLDLDQEVEVIANGSSKTYKPKRTAEALRSSLESRRDRDMMAPSFIDVMLQD